MILTLLEMFFRGTSCFELVTCANWQFKCENGQQCIHFMGKCDGRFDCNDGSDESHKWCRNVAIDSWPCDGGKASITRNLVCDGIFLFLNQSHTLNFTTSKDFNNFYSGKSDCGDNSDEAHCRCSNPSLYFDCALSISATDSNECINRELLCNNIADCLNGKDEIP